MPYSADLYYQAYHQDEKKRNLLVLIHGAGGDHLSWPPQIRRLPGYRVYSPDLPGHGKSKGPGLQRISAYGERLLSWLHEIECTRIALMGHSLGGAVALWLAIRDPELVKGLILVGSGASLPVNLTLIEGLANPQGFSTAVDSICSWSFSPNADPKLVSAVKKQMLASRPSVLAADFRACDAYDLSGEMDKVQSPTLVLVGEQDKMTPLRFSEELAAGIPGASLEVIPRTGHMVVLEQPRKVIKAVLNFLDGIAWQ